VWSQIDCHVILWLELTEEFNHLLASVGLVQEFCIECVKEDDSYVARGLPALVEAVGEYVRGKSRAYGGVWRSCGVGREGGDAVALSLIQDREIFFLRPWTVSPFYCVQ